MVTYAVEKNKKITLKQGREIELKFQIGLTREKPEKVTGLTVVRPFIPTQVEGSAFIYLFTTSLHCSVYTNALQILIHLIYMVTYETHFIITLQMIKLKYNEGKKIAQDHTTSVWWRQDLNLNILTLECSKLFLQVSLQTVDISLQSLPLHRGLPLILKLEDVLFLIIRPSLSLPLGYNYKLVGFYFFSIRRK